ncbi:MAG TPA: hypothetical protein VJC12_02380 [Candidatus Paceibacterota bacterium]
MGFAEQMSDLSDKYPETADRIREGQERIEQLQIENARKKRIADKRILANLISVLRKKRLTLREKNLVSRAEQIIKDL